MQHVFPNYDHSKVLKQQTVIALHQKATTGNSGNDKNPTQDKYKKGANANVDINKRKFPYFSQIRDLRELITGHQEIFKNPTNS